MYARFILTNSANVVFFEFHLLKRVFIENILKLTKKANFLKINK